MEKELLDLMKSKLPEAEVGAIKNIIDELEKAKKDIIELKNLSEALMISKSQLSKENINLLNEKNDLALTEKKQEDNLKKEKELEKKEFLIDLDKYKFEANVYKDTINLLLKNTQIRKDIQRQITSTSYDCISGRPTGTFTNSYPESEIIKEE